MFQKSLLLCVVVVPLLGACGGSNRTCVDPDDPYLQAQNNPPLRVPPGLSEPDRSAALAIPDAKTTQTRPLSGRGVCLEDPPSFLGSAGAAARSPEEVVGTWAQAWADRSADAVVGLYSTNFVAPTDSAGSAAWLEQRREQVAVGPVPDSLVAELRVEPDGADRRIATFVQKFGANSIRKELVLVRESGSWRIVAEKVVEVK
jgi:hypothetical protein